MTDSVTYDPFAGSSIEKSLSATDVQQELWLAASMSDAANCAYNQTVRLAFQTPLDPVKLRHAMVQTARRHPILRSVFSRDGGYFSINAEPDIDLVVDEHSSSERMASREASTPFDLQTGPLWRARLSRTADGDVLYVTMHHIAVDGWSTGLVLSELAAFYDDEDREPQPVATFPDFVGWLRSEATSGQRTSDLSFWREQFADYERSPSLPTPRERVFGRDFECGFHRHIIDSAQYGRIREYARSTGVTLSAFLTTAFAAYLSSLDGRGDDIVLGVPAAGQLDSGMLDLVGHCVNTLPLRLPVDGDSSFHELLLASKGRLLDAFERQKVTFGLLLQQTPSLREASSGPLVPIVFNVESGVFKLSMAGEQPGIAFLPRRYENFDVMVNCAVADDHIELDVHYSTALYDEAGIASRFEEYAQFLDNVIASANDRIADVDLLLPSQRELAASFVQPDRDFGPFEPITTRVAALALAAPEQPAFLYGDRILTYGELDEGSSRIASALRKRGIRTGDIVAVTIPRSLECMVALLGVLKCGAAYLPLDAELPEERIRYMIEDSGSKLVLTRDDRSAAIPAAVETLAFAATLSEESHQEYMHPAPGDRAYVIYTSGSTGAPKGVEVAHASLWNFLNTLVDAPGFTADDVFIGLTTLSFDISVLEVWLPLFLGARSVVVDRRDSQSGVAISRLIDRHGVTVVQATPSSWNLLLASDWSGGTGIKAISGGEPLVEQLVRQLAPRVRELWNAYGPTEATVWTMFKRIESQAPITLGRPTANTGIHLLSASGVEVPPGVIGELCISGECLALGYLGQPALTAASFRYHERIGRRLYHSGDLAYLDPDLGEVICLGRLDDQVKLRGYRIELGEVSSTFARLFDVDQAIALVIREGPKEYLAIVYRVNSGAVDTEDARKCMRSVLPEYMVPVAFVGRASLETTPNGKIDKRAAYAEVLRQQAGTAPAASSRELTELETLVLDIVREKLGDPTVAIDQSFFDVGGHSLIAMRVLLELGDLLECEVPVHLMFDNPVILDFAQALEAELLSAVETGNDR